LGLRKLGRPQNGYGGIFASVQFYQLRLLLRSFDATVPLKRSWLNRNVMEPRANVSEAHRARLIDENHDAGTSVCGLASLVAHEILALSGMAMSE